MESFARRFKQLREKRGWTQEDAADKIGVSRPTIAGYESEEKNRIPRKEMLHTIADLFDVSTDYLLGRTDYPKSIAANEQELNDAATTIRLIEEEAEKMGLRPTDPLFKKMLSNAFEMMRVARRKDDQ